MIHVYINLDFESDKPIYTQLVHQIIAGIARKELLPGERLPSVRAMAADIGINLHTVNKAYQQLKAEGFILIHRQRGVVVNPDGTTRADDNFIATLKEQLDPLIADSICRGINENEFAQLCKGIFNTYHKKAGEQNE